MISKRRLKFRGEMQLHSRYLRRCLTMLPSDYQSMDMQRVTIALFCVGGCAILEKEDPAFGMKSSEKAATIKWLLSLQTVSGGFRPTATFSGIRHDFDQAHASMTYAALSIFQILHSDQPLTGVDVSGVKHSLKNLQMNDGSFRANRFSEYDMRFVYCVCAICHYIEDYSTIDKDEVAKYVESCQSYEGGIGQQPMGEAHAGSTFCGVAALHLIGRLNSVFPHHSRERRNLVRWLIHLQHSGFRGRTNKAWDTCYSFWVVASLSILGQINLIDREKNIEYVRETRSALSGGFGKFPDSSSDPYHTYFALAALSLVRHIDCRITPSLILPILK
ncbi:hypothetical protein SNEBB_008895 [Seison nebaliae]|nr:hypothetical protein SNEBB_008895 [Seison nebaliae]